ncbi:MAG: glycosyltransferase family 4 protein [Bacteroidetes bacterium]|nr:glycosyltransferase family 4 protein [Bacteroidota bacterium]
MRIGIILTGDYSWAGGVYYSLNIIKLLHTISLTEKLTIVVIVNSGTPEELINELPKENIELSYLDKRSFIYRLWHKLKNDRFVADINALNLDVIYPLIAYAPSHSKLNCKAFYWMYDLQHKFLPELFSTEEIKSRDKMFEDMAANSSAIVFSSHDSKGHFEKFFANSKANKLVYNFVSLIDRGVNEAVTKSFNLPSAYFIVCNQFWPHKNHMVVLKALDHLIKEKKKIHIVFTGRFDDIRNKKYVDELKGFIAEKQLSNYITLTGFISRKDQISLIKNAKAVLQPSFFEGWSTVVEDAKALNKFLIISEISVNREQVKTNVLFFKPEDHLQLSNHLSKLTDDETNGIQFNYAQNIEQSKQDLIKLFNI